MAVFAASASPVRADQYGKLSGAVNEARGVTPNHRCDPGGKCKVAKGIEPLPDRQELRSNLLTTTDNTPGLSIRLIYDQSPKSVSPNGIGYDPVYNPGDFELVVTTDAGDTLRLATHVEQVAELTNDNLVGNAPGESIALLFPVDESIFIDTILGHELDVSLDNNTVETLHIDEVAVTTGALERLGSVDRPNTSSSSARWLGYALAVLLVTVMSLLALRSKTPP